MVLGTTNRSEYLTGWFTKYGDGAVDLEVILPLYKTRVSELAVKLDVPGAIRAKTPSGDILPGVTDEEMLGVPYSVLDRILLGLQEEAGGNRHRVFLGDRARDGSAGRRAYLQFAFQPGRCPLPGSGD